MARAPSRHAVEDPSQVRVAVEHAADAARAAGFGAAAVDTITLAATELAENLHRHAVGGELVLLPPVDAHGPLSVVALDRGPGVEHFALCLADGYTTTGSMGVGLGTVRRLATTFDAVSEPGRGTVVAAGFHHDDDGRLTHGPAAVRAAFDVAAVGFPIPSEFDNGDGWSAVRRGARLIVTVADGLGHGPLAAEASGAVVAAVPGVADLQPAQMVAGLSAAARHTRGAAVTVAVVTAADLEDGGTVHSSGLGNVTLVVVAPDGATHRAVSHPGTVGRSSPRTHGVDTPIPAGGALVVHTDGLRTQWDLAGRAELMRHHAVCIAASLWRDFGRDNDDTCVVVVRGGGRA